MKVQNKVIVVTGGGSGMGSALVLNLLSKSAKVLFTSIIQVYRQTLSLYQAYCV